MAGRRPRTGTPVGPARVEKGQCQNDSTSVSRRASTRDHSGLTGPLGGAFFGASVLYPFDFHSFSGQNVVVW